MKGAADMNTILLAIIAGILILHVTQGQLKDMPAQTGAVIFTALFILVAGILFGAVILGVAYVVSLLGAFLWSLLL
jgi:hypothetical protein